MDFEYHIDKVPVTDFLPLPIVGKGGKTEYAPSVLAEEVCGKRLVVKGWLTKRAPDAYFLLRLVREGVLQPAQVVFPL